MILSFKKSTIKTIASIFIAFLAIGILEGCSSTKTEVKTPLVTDINEKVKQSVDISAMRKGDDAKLKKLYSITTDELDSFVLYTAPSNIKADEILIVKVKDSSNIKNITDKISKRVETQSTTFKSYAPDEYFLLQNKVLTTKDNYILLVVSKDAEKISNAFDESFK